MLKFLLLLSLLAACSSGTQVQHYVGHVDHISDFSIQPNPSSAVEAMFEEDSSNALLCIRAVDRARFDTIKFRHDSTGWRWEAGWGWKNAPHPRALVRQTSDSLFVAWGWGFAGESFYLKRAE